MRLRQFARQVERAIRPLLAGSDLPLVLAASETLGALYRSVCTHPRLAATTIPDSADTLTDAELGARARAVLDGLYEEGLAAWRALFNQPSGEGRATTDIAQAARGAVASILVDIDAVLPGTVDEETCAVTFGEGEDPTGYGVADAIAGRFILNDGRVLAVRGGDIPGGGALAAILRYPA